MSASKADGTHHINKHKFWLTLDNNVFLKLDLCVCMFKVAAPADLIQDRKNLGFLVVKN